MSTVFNRTRVSEPALFTPCDTTEKVKDFPAVCVSTFSENIIQKFAALRETEKIAELYTANGSTPVYKIRMEDRRLHFISPESARQPAYRDLRRLLQWEQNGLCCLAPAACWMMKR